MSESNIEERAKPYTETMGVAIRNANKNGTDFADYVYDMCCKYMGGDHKLWSMKLIGAALQAEHDVALERAAKHCLKTLKPYPGVGERVAQDIRALKGESK